MKVVKKVCRKSRIKRRMLKALIFVEYRRRPFPHAAIVPPLAVSYARRCAVEPNAQVRSLRIISGDRKYSRHSMPVAKPDIPSFFITALKFVIEKSELSLCWQATSSSDRIHGETTVIGNDGPEVGDLHRNWSEQSADLGPRGSQQPSTTIHMHNQNCLP